MITSKTRFEFDRFWLPNLINFDEVSVQEDHLDLCFAHAVDHVMVLNWKSRIR